MVLLLCALSLFCADLDVVEYGGTERFLPFEKGDVAVSADGFVYMAIPAEAKILHFRPDGTPLPPIGRKGQRPGEFNHPSGIAVDSNFLFVLDYGGKKVSQFKLDGQFVTRFDFPGRGLNLIRAGAGWAIGDWYRENDEMTLQFGDNRLENLQTLGKWPQPDLLYSLNVKLKGGSERQKEPYCPIKDAPIMAASSDGKWLYLTHPGEFRITVLDLTEKKPVRDIVRSLSPIPFNETWGAVEVEKFKEENPRIVERVDFYPKYPKYFPIIREALPSLSGQLVVYLWTGNPDGPPKAMVLDHLGKDGALPYKAEFEARVLAVVDDHAYLSLFKEADGEATVARVPLNRVNEVIQKSPIAFDGSGGRFILSSR